MVSNKETAALMGACQACGGALCDSLELSNAQACKTAGVSDVSPPETLCQACQNEQLEGFRAAEPQLLVDSSSVSQKPPTQELPATRVSQRAPPPPRRDSQRPRQASVRPDQAVLQLVSPVLAAQKSAELEFVGLEQGSLMPVSWEDDSGILKIEDAIYATSLSAPPLPPRASRRAAAPVSSKTSGHELAGLALSLRQNQLTQQNTEARPKKFYLLSSAALLLLVGGIAIGYLPTIEHKGAENQQKLVLSPAKVTPIVVPKLEMAQAAQPALEIEEKVELKNPLEIKEPLAIKEPSRTTKKPSVRVRAKRQLLAPEKPAISTAAVQEPEAPAAAKFSISAVKDGLNQTIAQLGTCRTADDPSGVSRVVIVFSPSGRVTSAKVSGQPFAGTPTGSCIARRFRAIRIPAFDGEHRTIKKTVVVH